MSDFDDMMGILDVPPEQDCYFAYQEIKEAMKRTEFNDMDRAVLERAAQILKNAAGEEYANF